MSLFEWIGIVVCCLIAMFVAMAIVTKGFNEESSSDFGFGKYISFCRLMLVIFGLLSLASC